MEFSTIKQALMGTTEAINHARRARAQQSAEDKLDAIARAIEELAGAIDDVERRVKRVESDAATAASRR